MKPNIKIYDEKDQILSTESITNDKPIICILEIQGLKFTSRNFQLEIELKQSMVVSPDPFLDECFIKRPVKKQQKQQEQKQVEEQQVEEQQMEEQEEQINENITFDLDNLINQSAQHLAKNKDNIENIENNISPIDLEETFDKPKPLEKDIEKDIKKENKHKNLFDLEEADIDFTNLQDINEFTSKEEEVEEEVEDPNILKEVDLSSTLDNSLETLQLKKPNQVFYEIYQKAREKAKEAKKNAILAYLEMKNIKKTYMLDDIDESDNEFDEFASRDSSSEISDTESLEDE